jgi:hypothetical protein
MPPELAPLGASASKALRSHGDAHRMARVITWVAATIAIVVGALGPAAYVGLSWNF